MISIVIPAYRSAETISRAVASALSQEGGRGRAIVVIDDDCETTERILQSMNEPRLVIIRNKRNLGAPASRNLGLGLVATPYVTFLDADDFYQGEFLGPLVRLMQSQDGDIGFGPSVWWSPQRGFEHFRTPDYKSQEDVFVKWLGKGINVNTASVVWRAAFVRQIGGWDETIQRNQDGEIALRAILLGVRFVQSREGAGVWTNDRSLQRITTQTDNLQSLLYVVEKLLKTKSAVVPPSAKIAACADYCLVIAHLAYSNCRDDLGNQAMAMRRALGFSDYTGDRGYVLSAASRFIPKQPRKILWKAIRKTRDFIQSVRFGASRHFG